ncbi:ThiF family adenylyltransferase [Micromonospora sp. NPDC049081]|uniref:ThiF family adenylyltransferase n=1 Tax=Micromonospora sp. NPDC049081 TaxID=3155150 RepID=UPI0033E15A1D
MTQDRYSRLADIEWWDQDEVRGAHAVVAGAGALGNEVLKNLLLLGWGTITVVDLDTVEVGNLSRSVLYRPSDVGAAKVDAVVRAAGELNPDCQVDVIADDLRTGLGAGLLHRADVVLGCLDNVAARVALGQLAGQAGVLLIDGGLTTWEGAVRLYLPPDGPCYVCGLTDEDLRDLALRHSCLAYRVRAETARGVPTTPTVASTVGASMAQQAMRWLSRDRHDMTVPIGHELRFDLAYDRFWQVGIPVNPDCLLHPTPAVPTGSPGSWATDRWVDILERWRTARADDEVVLRLPLTVLRGWSCLGCGRQDEVHRVHPGDRPVRCPTCAAEVALDLVDQIDGTQSWHRLSPHETGFPRWSWVEAHGSGGTVVFELAEPVGSDGGRGGAGGAPPRVPPDGGPQAPAPRGPQDPAARTGRGRS